MRGIQEKVGTLAGCGPHTRGLRPRAVLWPRGKPDAWGLVAGAPVIAQVRFKPRVPDSIPPPRVSCGARGCPSSLCFLC